MIAADQDLYFFQVFRKNQSDRRSDPPRTSRLDRKSSSTRARVLVRSGSGYLEIPEALWHFYEVLGADRPSTTQPTGREKTNIDSVWGRLVTHPRLMSAPLADLINIICNSLI